MIESYEQALNYIHTRSRFGSQLSLNRMRTLMERLGNPQDRLKFVHIAGTNGKGSVTSMTAEILRCAGYRVGRYVSPYILDFRERMMTDGQMIAKEELLKLVNQIEPIASEMEEAGTAPTEFEVVTALAFCYFEQAGCEIVCLEVGLGGKLDSTNIIQNPLCCAITSIGLDHTAILGNTLEQIAAEKAGIIKKNCPVICSHSISKEAAAVICRRAAELNSSVIFPDAGQMELNKLSLTGTDFRYCGKFYHTALIGIHQMGNTTVVLEICKELRKHGFSIPEKAVAKGLEQVYFPARMQVLQKNPIVLLDGGHNPQGIEALLGSLRALDISQFHLVMGMMKDKDCDSVIGMLSEAALSVCCVTANDMPRVCPAEELAELFRQKKPDLAVRAFEDLKEALQTAEKNCKKDEAVIICGSLYLAERVIHLLCSPKEK